MESLRSAQEAFDRLYVKRAAEWDQYVSIGLDIESGQKRLDDTTIDAPVGDERLNIENNMVTWASERDAIKA